MADEPDLVGDGRHNHPDWVGFLQQTLEFWGYRPGPRDGEFGAELDDAVRTFQADNGLVADGWVGAQTWSVLQREAVVVDFEAFPRLLELAGMNNGAGDGTLVLGEVDGGEYSAARDEASVALAAVLSAAGSDGAQPVDVPTLDRAVHAGRAAVDVGLSYADRVDRSGAAEAADCRRDVELLRSEIDRLQELIGIV